MTYKERMYLNDLSEKVYNNKLKWQKMLRPELDNLTETLEDGTERKYKGYKYPTVEEVKALMEELWAEEQEVQKAKVAEDQGTTLAQETALDTMVSESEKLELYND